MKELVVTGFEGGANQISKLKGTKWLNATDEIIKHKVVLLYLADELGNISKACQVMGMSRDTLYRYKDALEKKKNDDQACGRRVPHIRYLGSQDAFYAGTLKGVGRVYQ